MPIISVVIGEGRSIEKKRNFIRAITQATVDTLGVRAEQVRVILNETPLDHYAVAGVTFAEAAQQGQTQ
ncbi:MAG: 2-hydroxymuconate tautomerase family protein [Sphingobium sp.]|nr:2-hydroxymuconate tautomerase family protein [Sphingobium sp.]